MLQMPLKYYYQFKILLSGFTELHIEYFPRKNDYYLLFSRKLKKIQNFTQTNNKTDEKLNETTKTERRTVDLSTLE